MTKKQKHYALWGGAAVLVAAGYVRYKRKKNAGQVGGVVGFITPDAYGRTPRSA